MKTMSLWMRILLILVAGHFSSVLCAAELGKVSQGICVLPGGSWPPAFTANASILSNTGQQLVVSASPTKGTASVTGFGPYHLNYTNTDSTPGWDEFQVLYYVGANYYTFYVHALVLDPNLAAIQSGTPSGFTLNSPISVSMPTLDGTTASGTISAVNLTLDTAHGLNVLMDEFDNTTTPSCRLTMYNYDVALTNGPSHQTASLALQQLMVYRFQKIGSTVSLVAATGTGGTGVTIATTHATPTCTVTATTINENGAFSIPFTYTVAGGTPTFGAASTNTALTPSLTASGNAGSGTVTGTGGLNLYGNATISVTVNDGWLQGTSSAQLTVNYVNHPPSFVKGADQSIARTAGGQAISGWATSIVDGAGDPVQTLNFVVNNDSTALFSSQPAVSDTGTLTFTPADSLGGTAHVSVSLHNSGGTANGGVDTSAIQTFNIVVTPVNHRPALYTTGDFSVQSILENPASNPGTDVPSLIASSAANTNDPITDVEGQEGIAISAVTVPGSMGTWQFSTSGGASWTNISTVQLSSGNALHLPALGANKIRFVPAVNVSDLLGTPTITIYAWDQSDGTTGGAVPAWDGTYRATAGLMGSAASPYSVASDTCSVDILPVTQPPSFTLSQPSITTPTNAGAQSISSVCTSIDPGPNQGGLTVSFLVNNTNGTTGLFSVQPSISTVGTLSYTPAANVSGSATFNVIADNGGTTANGGVKQSAAQVLTISVTNTSPTATINPPGAATNASPVPFTVAFDRTVTGLDTGDFTVTGGVVSSITGSGSSYTVQVTPSGIGTVTLSLPAGRCADTVGNTNASASGSTVYDNAQPTCTITPNGTSTNASPIIFTVTFNKSVTGFTSSSVTVTNGSVSSVAGSGAVYTVNVTPSADGTVTVSVPAGRVTDSSGNGNLSGSASVTSIRTRPTATISPNSGSINGTTISWTVTWSAAVTGFAAGDLTLTNATGPVVSGAGTTYTVTTTPTNPGLVTLAIVDAAAVDSVGNTTQSASASVTWDNLRPTCLVTPNGTVTNVAPITFSIVFTEPVTGLSLAGITLTNGASGPLSGSGTTYSLQVTSSGQGTVGVSINANAAFDAASNGNQAGSGSVTYDTLAPTLAITPNGGSTNASPIGLTFTFNETVTGFSAGDITLTNATAGVLLGSGSVYTMNVTPITNGAVIAQVGSNAATDAAGNGNTSASASVTSDRAAPAFSMTPAPGSSVNSVPIVFNVSCTKSVTGLTTGDFTITNGTINSLTGSGAAYVLSVNPSAQGDVTVAIANGAAADTLGNQSAPFSGTVTYDANSPICTITPSGTATNNPSLTATFTWNKTVTGFTLGDVNVTNATVGAFAGSGTTYTLVLTAIAPGPVVISVPAGVCTDLSSNTNLAAASTITYDTTPPSATITPNGTLTNASPISFQISWTENVSSILSSNIIVTGGSKGALSGSGASYTLPVTPSGDGPITIDIPNGAVTDLAGNANIDSNATVTSNRTAPTVSITPSGTTSSASPITFTLTYSKSVTGLSTGGLAVANGTMGTLSGSGTTYTIPVTPSGDGTVTLSSLTNAGVDSSGNGSVAGSASVTSDRTGPSVTVSGPPGSTNASPIPFTMVLTESVTGFTLSDVTVTNGLATGFSGSGSSYSVNVIPTGNGVVTITVPANGCTDAYGNNNLLGSGSTVYDSTQPSATITPSGTTTNAGQVTATITWSKPVAGFIASKVNLTNATAGTFTVISSTVYTVLVTPTADGTVTVSVPTNACQDAAGNTNAAATSSFTSLRSQPSCVFSPAGGATNQSPIPLTLAFSHAVTGLSASSFTVTNGSLSALSGSGISYTASLTISAQGSVTVALPGGSCIDAAGNGNTSANLTLSYDTVQPIAAITPNATTTNAATVPVQIVFSKPVSGLTAASFAVVNGSKGTLSGSGSSYTIPVTPTADGNVTITLNAGQATDNAGNTNPTTTVTFASDRSQPTVTITPNSGSTNASPIVFALLFSKPVSGLTTSSLVVTNGSLTGLTITNVTQATATVTPSANGAVTLTLVNNGVVDQVGNANTAVSAMVTSDRSPPTVAISSPSNPTNQSTITYNITFSKPVIGLAQSSLVATNGTVLSLSGSGTSYVATVSPSTDGAVTLSIPYATATDAAGNGNLAGSFVVTSDRTPPTCVVTPVGTTTNASPIVFDLQFSEAILGMAANGLTVTGGTKGAFTGAGAHYTLAVAPTADGVVTLIVPSSAGTDLAGNAITAAGSTVTSLRTPPTGAAAPSTGSTNANPIPFVFTFSTAVSGLQSASVTVGNGSLSAFSGSGTTWTATVIPTAQGLVTCDLATAAGVDAGGNTTPAIHGQVTYDTTSPICTITPSGTLTNASPVTMTLTFTEPVFGLVANSITVVNGSKGALSGSGTTYTIPVSPSFDGTVSVTLAANSAQDAAGNTNAASTASFSSDRTQPTISITPNTGIRRLAVPTAVTITASETVTGLSAAALQLVNCTASNFISVSGTNYTVDLQPTANGAFSVTVPANACLDTAGNPNASSSASFTADGTVPTCVITPNVITTNSDIITFSLTFSEPVTGLVVGSLQAANGVLGSLTGSGTTYSVPVTATSDGTVSLTLPSSSAIDAAGNPNTAATASVTVDRSIPALSISPSNIPTNASPITFTFSFSKPVISFSSTSISVTGGTKGTLSGSGTTYTLPVTPNDDGTITVSVADGACHDIANNPNTGATALVTSDRTRPTPTITPASGSTNTNPITYTITFPEAVTGFTASSIQMVNGTVSTFSASGNVYTVTVAPAAQGAVTVQVPANAATDAAGNQNLLAQSVITYETVAPTVAITPNAITTSASPIQFFFAFSENVVGFTANSISVTNGTKGSFNGSGANYTLQVTPSSDGAVTASVASNAAQDAAGNGNIAGAATVTSDRTPPSITITPNSGLRPLAIPTQVTITTSETVSGLSAGSLQLVNCTTSNFTAVNGSNYTVDLQPTASGSFSVTLPVNVCTDIAGNPNNSATASFTADGTVPTCVITPNATTLNADVVTFTLTFSKPVTGLVVGSLQSTNGVLGALTGSGTTYTVPVTATSDGTVSLTLPANSATDAAGNHNSAASASVTVDRSTPALSITPNNTPTNASPIVFSFLFTKPVIAFSGSSITVTGGTKGTLSGSGATYTIPVTPSADGAITVTVPDGVCHDAAGNQNTGATALVTSDRTPPTPTISPASGATNANPIVYTITFPDAVTGFTAAALQIVNGTVASFGGTGSTYTVTVTPAAEGQVALRVPAGTVADAAGNPNSLAQSVVTYDSIAPTLTITPNGTTTAASPILFVFTFSENVVGFSASSVTVSNGTKGTFSGSGTTYSLQVTPTADGPVGITVGLGGATDAAGNPNPATVATVTSSRTSPTVTIAPNGTSTSSSPIIFSFTWNQVMDGFTADAVNVYNGVKGTFSGSGTNFSLSVTPISDGPVTVAVPAGAVTNGIGNPNVGASATVTSDRTPPTCVITPNGTTTNASPITFTFRFSEPVAGFTAGLIQVANGTKGNFAIVSATTFTIEVAPIIDGTVLTTVPAGAVTDAAGNGNLASSASIISQRTGPTVSISPNGTVSASPSILFTVVFSAPVTGFRAQSFAVNNGTPGTIVGSGTTYQVPVTASALGDVTLTVLPNTVTDALGNPNTGSAATVIYRIPQSPVLVLYPGSRIYQRGSAAVRLDQGMTISDPDITANFDNSVIAMSITAGSEAGDSLLISSGTTNGVTIGLSGQTITATIAGNTTIAGLWTGGSSGSPLSITLGSAATPAVTTAILQSLAFQTPVSVGAPDLVNKTINLTFNDSTGTTPASVDVPVRVVTVAQPPVTFNGTASVLENHTIPGTLDSLWDDPYSSSTAITYEVVGTPTNGVISSFSASLGTYTFVPSTNFSGVASFQFRVHDTSNASNTSTVTITVAPVNQPPSFVVGSNVSLPQDSGVQTTPFWATGISAGPANELTQTVSFTVTNDNHALFTTQPAIDETGTLSFICAENAHGAATLTISVKDSGGTANGGQDTSASQTATITLVRVPAPPHALPTSIEAVISTPFSGRITIVDQDGYDVSANYTFNLTGISRRGTMALNATTGVIAFAPDLVGNDSVGYTATSSTNTISGIIDVHVDDAAGLNRPEIVSAPSTENEGSGTVWTYDVIVNANSVPVNAILALRVDGATNATVLQLTGNYFRITVPNLTADSSGTMSFWITVSDTVNHHSDTQRVIIAVIPTGMGPG